MNLGDFTNIVVAATSIVAIILGIASFWQQNNQAMAFLGIQILREWEQVFFSSDEMRRRRYVACIFLKQKLENESRSGSDVQSTKQYRDLPPEVWEILDTFDSIGIYVNKGIVDKELAWTTFYYWINAYWFLLHDHVKQLQEYTDGVPYLKNVEDMYNTLTAFAVKNRNLPPETKRCSKEKIQDFIEDEIKATYDKEWA
jgi:hypothetical protein